jgi:hypothetical protein
MAAQTTKFYYWNESAADENSQQDRKGNLEMKRDAP